jgi:hypothetical protein
MAWREYKKVKSSLDIEQNENVGDFDYLQQILPQVFAESSTTCTVAVMHASFEY